MAGSLGVGRELWGGWEAGQLVAAVAHAQQAAQEPHPLRCCCCRGGRQHLGLADCGARLVGQGLQLGQGRSKSQAVLGLVAERQSPLHHQPEGRRMLLVLRVQGLGPVPSLLVAKLAAASAAQRAAAGPRPHVL